MTNIGDALEVSPTLGLAVPAAELTSAPTRSGRRDRRFHLSAWIALGVLLVLLLAGLLARWVAPVDPLSQDLHHKLSGPTSQHLLGTDLIGRDVLSRLIYGARLSFVGVGIAVGVTIVLGVPWGLIAGFRGGVVDDVLMRMGDALLSFPPIILAIGIVAALGPGLRNSMIATGIIFAPSVARLLRSAVLPVRTSEYVLVSRSLGTRPWRVALRHVLPNSMAPVLVQIFALASVSLIIQAALGFLGLGESPPTATWGGDLATAYIYFLSNSWATVAPGLAITIGALCLSLVGDGVRNVLVIR